MKFIAQVEFELPDDLADADGVAATLDAIRDVVAGRVEVRDGVLLANVNVPAFRAEHGDWAYRADRRPS